MVPLQPDLMDSHKVRAVSRLEVVKTGRRRRWSEEDKVRIVAESYAGRRQVASSARRHGLSRPQAVRVFASTFEALGATSLLEQKRQRGNLAVDGRFFLRHYVLFVSRSVEVGPSSFRPANNWTEVEHGEQDLKLPTGCSADQRARPMFDFLPVNAPHNVVERVRCFFVDHGHDLAMAALLVGGAAAEQRVIACERQIEATRRLNRRLVRDLVFLHRLLSLEYVGDPNRIETSHFAELHPSSAAVEAICLLTDQLAELLHDIAAAGRGAAAGAK
jgi:hypothetical protein